MAQLSDIVQFCDNRVNREGFVDFPGAHNGLQFQNNGEVTKVAACVDAGFVPFRQAMEQGVDMILVHHGLFWGGTTPITGVLYDKFKHIMEGNLAVYSSHLPLDAHAEIGNNAMIAKNLDLKPSDRFLHHEGNDIGLIAEGIDRPTLSEKLKELFPKTYMGIEFGSKKPSRIAISSGSGASVVPEIIKLGIDTLITGELRQNHYNMAQEYKLNLYPCGHYATEVFGVQELARDVSEEFDLPYQFIATDCLL